MHNKIIFIATILVVLCLNVLHSAEFKLRNIYSDNMVLQRGVPIKIYGCAAANEKITADFAGVKTEAVASDKGEFILVFPAMEADGQKLELKVFNSRNCEIKLENILIGEVYLASGQSNMELPLWGESRFFRSYKGDIELKKSNYPQIRFIKIPHKISYKQVEKDIAGSQWQVVSPETAADKSAVAYYFAKQMHQELNVPIGIIQAAWSGTPIEPFISKEAFFDHNDEIGIKNFVDYELDFEVRKIEYNKKLKEWAAKFNNFAPELTAKTIKWKEVDYDDSDWGKITLPNFITTKYDINWVRKTIEISTDMAKKDLILTIGAVDDCDETFFNGVKIGSVGITVDDHWQVVRKYKIPASLIKAGKNVIAIRVFNYYAVGAVESNNHGIFLSSEDNMNKLDLSGEWRIQNEFVADIEQIGMRPAFISKNQRTWNSTLYNGMINPCIIYPIRGVIFYQGCSNGNEYQRYMQLFPLLIKDWRKKWNNPAMPFIFVQLSAFYKQSPAVRGSDDQWKINLPLYAAGDGYASIREVQTAALNIPGTGMAVSIDKGDQYDIHPAYKSEIGYRLAQEAMRLSFGKRGITQSPYFKEMKIYDDAIRLTFVHADNGFKFDGARINGFAIGDDQGNWGVADVKIINGNELVVSSPLIKKPTRVRYAFCSFPGDLNLYNKEGFPLAPFRTDIPNYIKQYIKISKVEGQK
jgi:sialate O-acetylesterase